MTTAPPQPAVETVLPSDLKVELWKRIDRRLRNHEVLITHEQFFKVMVREFRRVVGVVPSRPVKARILEMIMQVNEKHPETYLSAGIKNAVDAFFKSTGDNDAEAREMIVRMVKEGRTAMWLEGMGIDIDPRMLTRAVEQAIIRIAEGKKVRVPPPRRDSRKRRMRRGVGMAGVNTTTVEEPTEAAEVSAYAADPSAAEQAERIAEEKARTDELAGEEVYRAPRNLDAYLQQKLLSEEEVADLRKMYGIDKRLADGDIDEAEANRLRSEISDVVREKLKSRLREAVDNSVHYLNVFEALRRLPKDRDDAFGFLIRHKNQVVAENADDVNLSIVTKTLDEDGDLLDQLGTLMERKDHEMRMMAANMPPYRHVYTPDQKIGKFSVTESFVDDLRELSREELSDRLNSEDSNERIKAAADIKCVVALLTTLLKLTTPFHKEVRRLRIKLRMQRLFDGSVDEKDGRNRVQQFLRRRLNNLYPDLSRDERAEVEEMGQRIMDSKAGEDEGPDKSKRVYRV